MFRPVRILTLFAALGAALGLALISVRIINSVSFSEPLQMDTSGAEWESLFAVWRVVNGLELYTDRRAIPFNAVVYNWLFYRSYGAFTGFWLTLLDLSDWWLPTVARFFTLVGVGTGIVVSYLAFLRAIPDRTNMLRAIAIFSAVYLMTGPLIGWWGFTVRSDLWAMVFEIIAILAFLHYFPRHRMLAVLSAALAAYLAWSFKQVDVFAVGAVGSFLLLRREWKLLLILSLAMIGMWAGTLLFGGPDYRENILFSITAQFTWETYFNNLLNFAAKSLPLVAAFSAMAVIIGTSPRLRHRFLNNDCAVLAVCGLIVTGTIAGLASAKFGAAENYYFTLSFFAMLAVFASLPMVIEESGRKFASWAGVTAAGCLGQAVVAAVILSGHQGKIDLRPQHDLLLELKACIDELPRPVHITYPKLALPWLAPGHDPNFVFSFSYHKEREAGVVFERGGIRGLIESGYFRSLAYVAVASKYNGDGASLKGYRKIPNTCPRLETYLRD